LLLIIIIFFFQDTTNYLVTSSVSSKISGIFLKALIDIHPDDKVARLMLVQYHYKHANWSDAYNALLPLSRKDKSLETKTLLIDILRNELYSLSQGSSNYNTIKSRLISELEGTIERIQSIDNDQLMHYADLSKQLNRPDISSLIYEFLANSDTKQASHWFNLAAESQLAYSHPFKSARLYHSAFLNCLHDNKIAKYYSHKALQSFLYADKPSTALVYFQLYVVRFPDDISLLSKGRDISLALENYSYALKYGAELVSLDPENEIFIANQRDLGLATGNYDIALSMSKRLIDIDANNLEYQYRYVEIAEEANKFDLAKSQLKNIAYSNGDHKALDRLIKFSKESTDYQSLIEALIYKSRSISLSDSEIDDIIYAYTKINSPYSSIPFLEKYTKSHFKHIYALKSLAKLYEKNNNIDNALATWLIIQKYTDNELEVSLKISELANSHIEKQKAFNIAMKDIVINQMKNKKHLEILGNISWDLKYFEISKNIYERLWAIDKTNTFSAERLIMLHKKTNSYDNAVDIAIDIYNNGEHPRFLLIAIDILISISDWTKATTLLKSINSSDANFINNESYYLQNALVALHNKKYREAEKYYNHALSINPNSTAAEIGLLWLYVEINDYKNLTAYFSRIRNKKASSIPEFWQVYAIALAKLGWTEQSQYWHRLIINNKKHDINTLKLFSESLVNAGKNNSAARLNKYIFSFQRNKLLSNLQARKAFK
jgi:tetratricopeptide (TPR) repeat protein